MLGLPHISNAEWEVMLVIWDKSPIKSSEVIEIIAKSKEWKPKTIQTLIRRLLDKGVIEYRPEGKVYLYSYLISKEKYVKHETETFLSKVYQGSLNHMVLSFMKHQKLTGDEVAELIRILEDRKPE